MTDVIILMILIILIGAAVSYIVKAKRNGTRCIGCRTIHISGMECQHCVSSVMEALNAVDGVTARVNLSKGNAEVSCDRVVSEDELRCAIERAGFQVISIS